jgi:hypothetical protein
VIVTGFDHCFRSDTSFVLLLTRRGAKAGP